MANDTHVWRAHAENAEMFCAQGSDIAAMLRKVAKTVDFGQTTDLLLDIKYVDENDYHLIMYINGSHAYV